MNTFSDSKYKIVSILNVDWTYNISKLKDGHIAFQFRRSFSVLKCDMSKMTNYYDLKYFFGCNIFTHFGYIGRHSIFDENSFLAKTELSRFNTDPSSWEISRFNTKPAKSFAGWIAYSLHTQPMTVWNLGYAVIDLSYWHTSWNCITISTIEMKIMMMKYRKQQHMPSIIMLTN